MIVVDDDSFFTGVGSRDTPLAILRLMSRFSRLQRRKCRTGGARGADEAFETNWDPMIYLPHMKWRGKDGFWRWSDAAIDFADRLLKEVFPYDIQSQQTREFFRRNCWQVLGVCETESDVVKSDYVVCWTPDGAVSIDDYQLEITGGTGIAINVASIYKVNVLNLQRKDHRAKVVRWCQKKENEYGLHYDHTTGMHFSKEHGAQVLAEDLFQAA